MFLFLPLIIKDITGPLGISVTAPPGWVFIFLPGGERVIR
jgi:hypothetical protein